MTCGEQFSVGCIFSTAICLLTCVCCLPSAVRPHPSSVCCMLFAVSCQLLLTPVNCHLSIITVYPCSSIVYCLLSNHTWHHTPAVTSKVSDVAVLDTVSVTLAPAVEVSLIKLVSNTGTKLKGPECRDRCYFHSSCTRCPH